MCARLTNSAPRRETMMRSPFSSSVRTSSSRSCPGKSVPWRTCLFSSRCENFMWRELARASGPPLRAGLMRYLSGSWEQAAHLFRLDHSLDTGRHSRGAMRDFVFLGPPNHLRERMLDNAEKFVGPFRFGPKKALQPLAPFEVGD